MKRCIYILTIIALVMCLFVSCEKTAASKYTVTFDANGGDGVAPEPIKSNSGTAITLPSGSSLSKQHHLFMGWNTQSDYEGTNYNAGASYTVTANIVLYAKWDPVTYTVSFNGNTHTSGNPPAAIPELYLYPITIPGRGTMVKTGHTFSGWNSQADGAGTPYAVDSLYTVVADTTFYAQWAIGSFTVIFHSTEHTVGEVPGPISTTYSNYITLPDQGTLDRTGHTFGGWSVNSSGLGTTYAAGDSIAIYTKTNLYARWNIIRYTVTYNGNGHTGGNVPPNATVNFGATHTLPAGTVLRTGHTFGGWNTQPDGLGDNYPSSTQIPITSDMDFYAKWNINSYTVTFHRGQPSNEPIVGEPPAPITDIFEAEIILPDQGELIHAGHNFLGWNTVIQGQGDHFAAGDTLTIPARNMTLYAQWTLGNHTVYFDGNGHTSGAPPDSISVRYGTTVYLPTHNTLAKTDSSFAYWSLTPDDTGDPYATGAPFIVLNNYTFYAIWIPNAVVTFDGNGNTGGSPPAPMATNGDAWLTLPDKNTLTKTGYEFMNWNTRPDGLGTDYLVGSRFFAEQDTTLYAKWDKICTVEFRRGRALSIPDPPPPIITTQNAYIIMPDPTTQNVDPDYFFFKPDSTFMYWSTRTYNASYPHLTSEKYYPGDRYRVVQDTTFYAIWGKTVPVIFIGNGNTSGTPPDTMFVGVMPGEYPTIRLPGKGTLERLEHRFRFWMTTNPANMTILTRYPGDAYTLTDEDITNGYVVFYAFWIPYLEVHFDGNNQPGGSGLPPLPNPIVTSADSTITIPGQGSLIFSGHLFLGWQFEMWIPGPIFKQGDAFPEAPYSSIGGYTLHDGNWYDFVPPIPLYWEVDTSDGVVDEYWFIAAWLPDELPFGLPSNNRPLWKVLTYDSESNSIFVIRKQCLPDAMPWHITYYSDYLSSSLRNYLVGSSYFFNNSRFTNEDRSCVLPGFAGEPVFLLNYEEAGNYFVNDTARKANAEGSAAFVMWWLREPGYEPRAYNAMYVDPDGVIIREGAHIDYQWGDIFVRPAMWINLDAYYWHYIP